MTVAERNRAIKRVLIGAFPGCKVSVTGDRGTAYGWVNVRIDWTPLDSDQAREMKRLVWQLLDKAGPGKEIGTMDMTIQARIMVTATRSAFRSIAAVITAQSG
jgi:hypothetical protein